MILPILISLSVTPVSYFFCATADTVAAAMIHPARPRETASERPGVLMKFAALRFMNFLLRVPLLMTAFVGRLPQVFLRRGDDSRAAALPEAAVSQSNGTRKR